MRHIFERTIRRFGWEDVYSCAAEEDARKVLLNIKKRKDRARRKRARTAEGDEDEEVWFFRLFFPQLVLRSDI